MNYSFSSLIFLLFFSNIVNAVSISDVSPNRGSVAGGTTITIAGDDLSAVTYISVGDRSVTSFTIDDINTITAVTNWSREGLANIRIYEGNTYTIFEDSYTFLPPTISSVSPNQGPVSGGTTVTITGEYFSGTTDVSIGGRGVESFAINNNTITAVTSAVSSSSTSIVLYSAKNYFIFENKYTYISPPGFYSISPSNGNTLGGSSVTITGNNFMNGATATINDEPLTNLTISATSITGTTPALPVGTYDVVISNPDGQSATRVNGFVVNLAPAPALTSITPPNADSQGGGIVTITGNNFLTGAVATINGTTLTDISVNNLTTITAAIPALAVGTHDLIVSNPDGQVSTLSDAFTVTPSPEFMAGDLAPRGAPDGQLNVADLLILQRFIFELEAPTAKEFLIANNAPLGSPDNQLNVADILILQRAINGEIALPNVIDIDAPQISIISPINNSFTSTNSITIMGMLDEPGELTINGADVPVNAFFSFSRDVSLSEGVNTFDLNATDIYGNSQSQILTINKDTKAPAAINANHVTLSESAGQVTITGTAGSVEAGSILNITVNGSTTTAIADVNGAFNALISATSGDQVQITVTDGASNNSSSMSYTVGATLQIISPQASSDINAETVNIVGVFANENNSGINVNGQTACTYNNNFYVNNMSLSTGDNTLTATYTTVSGATDSTSINVARTSAASYKLTAYRYCGIAPFNVIFDLDTGSDAIHQLDIDYDNDGVIDLTTSDPVTATLQHDYITPGVYPVTAWLTTTTGTKQLSLNIVVNDQTQQGNVLQSIWNGMTSELIAGNKSNALSYINGDSQALYDSVFDSLMPNMTDIFDELSNIVPINVGRKTANYAIIREENDQIKTYIVNFIRGSDGVWRIDSM